MSKAVKIRKGLNIRLQGEAEKVHASAHHSAVHAIKPTDFFGLTPKLVLKEGAKVKCGTTIFFDKYNEQVKYVSPVSGEITEIVRGEKRRILEVRILADKEVAFEEFGSADASAMSRDEVKAKMLEAGAWPFIKMRPLDVVANPADQPKAIVISAFDSSPLAPDYDFIVHGHEEEFQAGIDALAKLTEGKIHLNVRGEGKPSGVFTNCRNVVVNRFSGAHPAGNVGTQIHHLDPINKGEVVWTVNAQDVMIIGKLFLTGKLDSERIVALTGANAKAPKYYKARIGAQVKSIAGEGNEGSRIISGNVLTGDNVGEEGFLGFYHHKQPLFQKEIVISSS